MMNWMIQLEQKAGSGGNSGEVLPYSCPKYVSNRDSDPILTSDGDFLGGLRL